MLDLDQVWWLVTPLNPLKAGQKRISPHDERLEKCRAFIGANLCHKVCDFEYEINSHNTFDTVTALRRISPYARFVWITGSDNALLMHKWVRWRDLLGLVSMAHIPRPPLAAISKSTPYRLYAPQKHIFLTRGMRPELRPNTSFWLPHGNTANISSSEIRAGTLVMPAKTR